MLVVVRYYTALLSTEIDFKTDQSLASDNIIYITLMNEAVLPWALEFVKQSCSPCFTVLPCAADTAIFNQHVAWTPAHNVLATYPLKQ